MKRLLGDYQLLETRDAPDACTFAYRAQRGELAAPVELRVTGGCGFAKSCAAADAPGAAGPSSTDWRKLQHPNLVRVRDMFAAEGCVVYATDLKEATPFDEYLLAHGGILEAEEALDLLLPVGEALAHLHAEGRIHGGVDLRSIRVEQGTERAFLASLSPCAAMGLYTRPECVPGSLETCPAEPMRAHWPPTPGFDVRAFGALLRQSMTGTAARPGEPPPVSLPPDLGAALEEAVAGTASMPELLDRLRSLRPGLQRQALERRTRASAIRLEGRRRKRERRGHRRRAIDRAQLEAPDLRSPRGVAQRFARLGRAAQASAFLLMAALSSRIPLEGLTRAAPPALPGVVATSHPGAHGPAAAPAPPAPAVVQAPNPPAPTPVAGPRPRNPEERLFLSVAQAAWEHPTGPDTYAPRLKSVWELVRSLPAEERDRVATKKDLLELRKTSARAPDQGYRELDRLIQRCRQHLDQRAGGG